MSINDDPSPIKRLYVETLKMIQSSLHRVSSFPAHGIYFILIGLVFIVVSSFYFTNLVSSQTEKKIVSESLQRYNACIFGKNLVNQDVKTDSIIADIDDECSKLSFEGKIMKSQQNVRAQEIAKILEGTPMQEMASDIATKDKTVAALIVGIANIESQLGRHAPWKAGIDCYNYWGYKTSGSRGQALGHACFGSRKEAVDTIAKRLEHFVYDKGKTTPAQMVYPWKCGGSCAQHSPESVSRWIGVVNIYYNQIIAIENSENINIQKSKFLSKK